MSDSERDEIIKRGGNSFVNGYNKAKEELFAGVDYQKVLKDTIPWIRRFWEAPPRKKWTQVRENDASRLVEIAYDEYHAYNKK